MPRLNVDRMRRYRRKSEPTWAIKINTESDAIELAPGVTVYSNGAGSYSVVRHGVVEAWVQASRTDVAGLLASVATPGPLPADVKDMDFRPMRV